MIQEVVQDREGKTVGRWVPMYYSIYVCMSVCLYVSMTNAIAVRRLCRVASRPMLIPFNHGHLVTFL